MIISQLAIVFVFFFKSTYDDTRSEKIFCTTINMDHSQQQQRKIDGPSVLDNVYKTIWHASPWTQHISEENWWQTWMFAIKSILWWSLIGTLQSIYNIQTEYMWWMNLPLVQYKKAQAQNHRQIEPNSNGLGKTWVAFFWIWMSRWNQKTWV